MNIKYQLVPSSKHREKNAERAIKTFNNHLIAGLCSVDKYFNLQLWDRLLQQATIGLNLLSKSRNFPHISDYTHIFGEFYFNRTHLAPPGTIVFMHNRPNYRESWAPHGEDDWYTGPAMEHYRCHKSFIPKTRAEKIRHSRTSSQNSSYATDVFHGCNLSCHTRSILCTTEYSTCKPFSKIRAWT